MEEKCKCCYPNTNPLKNLSNDKRYGGSHLHTPCSDIAILICKCLPHKLRRRCLRFCHHNLILKLGNSQSDSEEDCTPCNQPSSSLFQVPHIRHSQNSFQKVSTGTHQIEQKSHKMISNCWYNCWKYHLHVNHRIKLWINQANFDESESGTLTK